MTDILPFVAGLLEPLNAQTELSFRSTRVTFPLIVLSVPSNSALTCGCEEILSRITVQVDAYTRDKLMTMQLAQSIDAIMTAHGFTRSIAQPFTEGELERYMMQYSCVINYTHNTIQN